MPLPSDNSLTFRTTDLLKWGVGKGSPLTGSEVDNNFWWILLQLADLQNNPALPKEINSITVSGGKMTITLSDGITTFGPFDIPTQAFNWTDAYQSGHNYKKMDVFTAQDGCYVVLQDHTSATTFDPAALSGGNPLYALMFPFQNVYDISFFFPGSVGNGLGVGDAMFALRFARDAYLPAGLAISQAGSQVAPSALFSVDIQKNGVTIGTLDYDPGASVPAWTYSFTADVQFTAGDLLTVLRPATIDATCKGLSMTLAAKKGTI